tara:strand:- start:130 stop:303 length:174 start_codon:yes stop_codon:yes gene_type:complete
MPKPAEGYEHHGKVKTKERKERGNNYGIRSSYESDRSSKETKWFKEKSKGSPQIAHT